MNSLKFSGSIFSNGTISCFYRLLWSLNHFKVKHSEKVWWKGFHQEIALQYSQPLVKWVKQWRKSTCSCGPHYLRSHVFTDGLDFCLNVINQQVELILDKLQPINLILSVLQRCHSEAPPPARGNKFTKLTVQKLKTKSNRAKDAESKTR